MSTNDIVIIWDDIHAKLDELSTSTDSTTLDIVARINELKKKYETDSEYEPDTSAEMLIEHTTTAVGELKSIKSFVQTLPTFVNQAELIDLIDNIISLSESELVIFKDFL